MPPKKGGVFFFPRREYYPRRLSFSRRGLKTLSPPEKLFWVFRGGYVGLSNPVGNLESSVLFHLIGEVLPRATNLASGILAPQRIGPKLGGPQTIFPNSGLTYF